MRDIQIIVFAIRLQFVPSIYFLQLFDLHLLINMFPIDLKRKLLINSEHFPPVVRVDDLSPNCPLGGRTHMGSLPLAKLVGLGRFEICGYAVVVQ
jgi:hypothetical protein